MIGSLADCFNDVKLLDREKASESEKQQIKEEWICCVKERLGLKNEKVHLLKREISKYVAGYENDLEVCCLTQFREIGVYFIF